jgi:hypothetical protein
MLGEKAGLVSLMKFCDLVSTKCGDICKHMAILSGDFAMNWLMKRADLQHGLGNFVVYIWPSGLTSPSSLVVNMADCPK